MANADNTFRHRLELLYMGRSRQARLFRYGLLAFDLASICYFVFSSLLAESNWIYGIDIAIAVIILADFLARLWIADSKARYFSQLTTWADIVVIVSLILPAFFSNLLFLRVLRALRLLRSYHVLRDLRAEVPFFRRNEEIIQSLINLAIFVFVVTALVYVLQARTNPDITSYVDALYFTITTLTTTGFGDITLQGSSGRWLSIIIMVIGVALFIRLVQTIFRPPKVRQRCPDCGLNLHDTDAVHCKHCGRVIDIETEGAT
jgi:voltage-gated potassium channel